MRSFVLALSIFTATSVLAQEHLRVDHNEANSALLSALDSVKREGDNIKGLQYTADGEWFLLAGKRRWYSDASYFQKLDGNGGKSFRGEVERLLRAGQHIRSFSIGPQGNWVLLLSDGTLQYSSGDHFRKIGLSTTVRSLQAENKQLWKVILGPQDSWIIEERRGHIYSKGLPSYLESILEGLEESSLRLTSLAFRFKRDGRFHYVATAGVHFWKSGGPGSPLWKSMDRLQKSQSRLDHVATGPGTAHVAVSQYAWRPQRNDLLNQIEQSVGGTNIWRRMRHHGIPGMSIGLLRKGKVWAVRSYGWRDRGSWAPVTNDTIFSAASISKAVASAGIVRVAEEGRLDLDRTVWQVMNADPRLTTTREWFRSLKNPRQKDFVEEAPFHSLLSHTSGLGVHGIGLDDADTKVTLRDIIMGKRGREDKVEPQWIPQSKFDYSGGAFSIAESITEETYGTSFASLMRSSVLGPLGMSDSTFGQLSAEQKRKHYAFGHDNNQPLEYRVCVGKAAGGLFTTARDYARFLEAMMNLGRAKDGTRLLREESVRRMMTSAPTRGSSLTACAAGSGCGSAGEMCIEGRCMRPLLGDDSDHPGLGIRLSRSRLSNGLPAKIWHGGSQDGFCSYFEARLAKEAGIVILTNGDCGLRTEKCKENRGGCALRREIIDSFKANL